MEIKNRKSNDFDISATLEAGIILIGREVKNLKECDLTGSRCIIKDVPLLVGSYIAKQEDNFATPYEPGRDRKLLLRKSEIRWLLEQIKKGFSIIPIKLYAKKSKYKILLGVGKALKKFDKRQKEIEKQVKKEIYD